MQATRELLNKHLGVRLTQTESRLLEKLANEAGYKKSDIARRIIVKWLREATKRESGVEMITKLIER